MKTCIAAMVALLIVMPPAHAVAAGDTEPVDEPKKAATKAAFPERPPLGYALLGPRSIDDDPLQVGWMLTIGLVSSPVTLPWFAGVRIFQGKHTAKRQLEGDLPTLYRIQYEGGAVPDIEFGDYYALVIGIDHYDDLRDLETAVDDARAIGMLLRDDYEFEVTELIDADFADIMRSLHALRDKVGKEDNLLIYYAGHGSRDLQAREGYWIPRDADYDEPTYWIARSTILSQVRAVDAKHILIVSDSCFAGMLSRSPPLPPDVSRQAITALVKRKARAIMTSGGVEPVSDSAGGKHSVFAGPFIAALESNDGVLGGGRLFLAVRDGVTAILPNQVPEYAPIRGIGDDGGEFLFVRPSRKP